MNYAFICLLLLAACTTSQEPEYADAVRQQLSLWSDSTSVYLPETAEWTNRVEAADINQDGRVDILFANGGNYSEPGEPEPCRVFLNQGAGQMFREITADIFGDRLFFSRVVKVRDVNADGLPDIFVGATYQTQSRLYLNRDNASFEDVTGTHLPQQLLSVGDAEFGDVDGDGDLDLALVDWGPGSNMTNEGGITRLWLNDGNGMFTDATSVKMPDIHIRFSWDFEFVDYDNDFDLDMAISCKRCAGSFLFVNDGTGQFEHALRSLPSYTNNYEFEPMDVDMDFYLDLVTVNDGDIRNGKSYSRKEHLFRNIEGKYFNDETEEFWPDHANIGEDDNNIVFVDFNSDRHPDFLLSSLTGEDRLLVNDGTGHFSLMQPVIQGAPTPHTLSLVVTDLNGDHKWDIVMGQGEGKTDLDERIFIGTSISPDTAYPRIPNTRMTDTLGMITVQARIHDCKSPSMPEDWTSVVFVPSEGDSIPMQWYGEYLWQVSVPDSLNIDIPTVCATDAAGNRRCRVVN